MDCRRTPLRWPPSQPDPRNCFLGPAIQLVERVLLVAPVTGVQITSEARCAEVAELAHGESRRILASP